jgi:multidrug resistance protein, MATE family
VTFSPILLVIPAWPQSWRSLLRLAFPIWLTQLLRISWGLLDTAMLAAYSSEDLAAMALAGSFYIALNVAGKGVLQALSPLVAYLHGQRRWTEIGAMARQACWVALLLTAVGVVALLSPLYLGLANVEPSVHDKAHAYLHAIAFGLFGSFLLRVIGAMLQAVGRPHPLTVLMLIGLALKLPLNYALVYGSAIAPAMGVVGCAIATSVVNSLLCILGLMYLWRAPVFARFALFAWEWPNWRRQWELLRFGIPFGFGYWLEVAVASAFTLAISRLGTDALAANQIVGNFVDLLFTIPLAISLAVSVQIGHLLGQGQDHKAFLAGRFGLRVAFLLALAAAGIVWLLPRSVLLLYRPPHSLEATIIGLLGLLVFYHLADALQSVASFLNRAHKNAWWPVIAYSVCMWGVALGSAHVLTSGLMWEGKRVLPALAPGLQGFYLGQTLGLALAGVSMWTYWRAVLVGKAGSPIWQCNAELGAQRS